MTDILSRALVGDDDDFLDRDRAHADALTVRARRALADLGLDIDLSASPNGVLLLARIPLDRADAVVRRLEDLAG
jgi:hypothetical protein